jgi:hypothetical protein
MHRKGDMPNAMFYNSLLKNCDNIEILYSSLEHCHRQSHVYFLRL